ncbi:[4Fe-4S] proteins maturation [Komagataella phaffii CBS 7435]|uniref:Iron-sulfur assembly protein 1 n=2 Tax=Komagataella phaffii TaxID=460519 RepID=C4QW49_KOMPG|nr:Mitochondrial matrix protein involved in biogenesis of iron-sulfur (Fe/S) cluster of Fe/S proteins [Komagataella phaffii GS115]AOA61477.1 GQ67_02681T0 [Komagataella phaffii]CAH2446138.1 [4Fe-4S] proteins maturation [Komagataella phaffii CBS 7435]AOA65770.1 GQ68_02567T0 [Komagataella phaffii GS115]CAY67472.1 Mitochondrial matrix protein involved in biogenesis of iron-sulfur (Fe/S) cluster of Fe/S proteins [Komagataella phaffii GS115]SCV11801.1 [4Fe-4S] proteins maturation [Komagataella phaff
MYRLLPRSYNSALSRTLCSSSIARSTYKTLRPTVAGDRQDDFFNSLQFGEASKWSKHSLPRSRRLKDKNSNEEKDVSAASEDSSKPASVTSNSTSSPKLSTSTATSTLTTSNNTVPPTQKTQKKRRALRPRKALITLSPSAVSHLRALSDLPEPKLTRIGVRNRGCSGLTYHLEYVSEPGKFDELVEQDGVKVLIDSKALFSIVGSEMDWVDDKLSSKFVFKNPNSKGTCGCGESFMV